MTEIRDGMETSLSKILASPTFRGEELKFEKSPDNDLVYIANTNISDEAKKAGNFNYQILFSLAESIGTVRINHTPISAGDDDPEFKDLTDAERVTKRNSLAFQRGIPEPQQDGTHLDEALGKALSAKPEDSEQAKQDKRLKEEQKRQQQEQQESKKQEQEANKQEKELNRNTRKQQE